MNFSDLGFKQSPHLEGFKKSVSVDKFKKEVLNEPPISNSKLDFNKDILKKGPKLNKEQLRLIEPGHKVPVANFLQIGQHCDECDDVTAHAHDPSSRKIICLKCKTTKNY